MKITGNNIMYCTIFILNLNTFDNVQRVNRINYTEYYVVVKRIFSCVQCRNHSLRFIKFYYAEKKTLM